MNILSILDFYGNDSFTLSNIGAKIKYYLHRYQKTKIDCLRFVMCPPLGRSSKAFFAAAINSTNEANQAGSTRL
jgi:hypothetical protein